MIAIADPTTITIPQLVAMTAVVIDQQNAVSEAYRAYKDLLTTPTPTDLETVPTQREAWMVRKWVAAAAKQALTEVLTENGTPLETPLKLVVKGQTVTLRLYRLTDGGRLSVQIVADAWGFAG